MRGFLKMDYRYFLTACGLACGLVRHRLKSCSRLAALAQDLGSHFLAGPATCSNAQLTLKFPQILNPGLRSLSNLFVGYRVADADVHDFSVFLSTDDIQSQMRMIVNSIKYKPRHACRSVGPAGARLQTKSAWDARCQDAVGSLQLLAGVRALLNTSPGCPGHFGHVQSILQDSIFIVHQACQVLDNIFI